MNKAVAWMFIMVAIIYLSIAMMQVSQNWVFIEMNKMGWCGKGNGIWNKCVN